ncbi:uncharacterized protein PRCAT00002138001 [Priceomyces carsonii]|uniref:uncharacterized protein n=1 Tax=Priceomyces carsonii TaxID=28549 RepID=UPI002EDAF812|nr:unnamed protein product [Priceomyces carsonii]
MGELGNLISRIKLPSINELTSNTLPMSPIVKDEKVSVKSAGSDKAKYLEPSPGLNSNYVLSNSASILGQNLSPNIGYYDYVSPSNSMLQSKPKPNLRPLPFQSQHYQQQLQHPHHQQHPHNQHQHQHHSSPVNSHYEYYTYRQSPQLSPPVQPLVYTSQNAGFHPTYYKVGQPMMTIPGGFSGSEYAAPEIINNRVNKCHRCGTTETPEWRRGPNGVRTLCNACGLFHAKLVKKKGATVAAREVLNSRVCKGKNGRRISVKKNITEEIKMPNNKASPIHAIVSRLPPEVPILGGLHLPPPIMSVKYQQHASTP